MLQILRHFRDYYKEEINRLPIDEQLCNRSILLGSCSVADDTWGFATFSELLLIF
jgi:hypothetical protein